MKKIRLLIVAPSFDILGGQSVQAARLLERLRDEPSLEVGFLPINPRLPGILRKLQSIKYVRTVVTSLLYCLTLLLRVPKYDVIHIFSASYFSFVLAPTPAILTSKLFGKKVLLNYHSGEADDHLRRWRRSAIPTIQLCDMIVVPSDYLVGVFEQFGLQARAILNLIETDTFRFTGRDPLRPKFLSNRNFESHYGVDRVLRAFAIVQERFADASLIVAGFGPNRDALESLARELGLRNTEFTGKIPPEQINALYESADIFLNGSEIDNQPLSILEAFACGLPVVSTDAGGIPDMVTNDATGILVERGDYQSLAESALRLLDDNALAQRLIKQALNECQKYSWEAVRDQWLSVYRELAGQTIKRSKTQRSKFTAAGRIKALSADEIRVRGRQALVAFCERNGWSSLSKLPSDQAMFDLFASELSGSHTNLSAERCLEHFQTRTEPQFFASFANRDVTSSEFQLRWPSGAKAIVEQAERITNGRFDLLGYRNLNFGDPINWQLEPVANKQTPLIHWSRLNYLDAEITGDKKIVWELNRHQYFATLGQAYWLTGDERFARTFVEHLNSWIDQNPPKLGINWASSLEVAFRSISWLWAFYFFKSSPSLSPGTFLRALKFLYLNARHLETYLSTYFSPNTHLTGEALGLFYLGTLLPELKPAARWRDVGTRILLEQLPRHVRADGSYFEQSSYYHRYTTDFYLHFLLLSDLNGKESKRSGLQPAIDNQVETKLKQLLDHLMYIMRPDGTTPFFGDDDGGRLAKLDRRAANDFRAPLSTGAVVFRRGDYKRTAGGLAEETLWLLGPEGASEFDRLPASEPSATSVAFKEAGLYVMRDDWTPQSNYLLFDCGPHGYDNCGHAHADALSFELAARGRTLLIDPGTYTYTGSLELRDLFRSSAAHNTLTVDNQSSSVPDGPFSWKTIANSETLAWISRDRFDYVAGKHDGYQRLDAPASHTRRILFLKNDYWLMEDEVLSEYERQYDLWFHLDSNADVVVDAPDTVLIDSLAGEPGLRIWAFAQGGNWRREEGWHSHSYGEREQAAVCVFSTLAAREQILTFMLPMIAGEPARRVRAIEAIGGRAFEVVSDTVVDLVMIRDDSRVETARLVSDFECTWARFSSEREALPEELVLIGGRRLELDGREILRSELRIDYLVATRKGDQFRVETDAGVLDLSLPVSDLERVFLKSLRLRSQI